MLKFVSDREQSLHVLDANYKIKQYRKKIKYIFPLSVPLGSNLNQHLLLKKK